MRSALLLRGRGMTLVPARSLTIRRRKKPRSQEAVVNDAVERDMAALQEKHPMNDDILEKLAEGTRHKVLLVDEAGAVLGRDITFAEAQRIALEQNRDLLLMNVGRGEESPTVVKLLVWRTWLAERRQMVELNHMSRVAEEKPKEFRLSINISEHDAAVKRRKIVSMLEDDLPVSVTLFFAHPVPYDAEVGEAFFSDFLEEIDENLCECSAFRHNAKSGEIQVILKPREEEPVAPKPPKAPKAAVEPKVTEQKQ